VADGVENESSAKPETPDWESFKGVKILNPKGVALNQPRVK
jgi:hypothetical protein